MVDEERCLQIVLDAVRVCAEYKPKFGLGRTAAGLGLDEFQELYQKDAFYRWFGLDSPMLYAAHKAAGGMTSIYRQIGIGSETLFREVIRQTLDLSTDDVKWAYQPVNSSGRVQTLHLDGRVPLDKISNVENRNRVHQWMRNAAKKLDIEDKVFSSLDGIVFEVRQGYKSKDSKRQRADLANAAAAYTRGYLPCNVVLSTQIDSGILLRYRAAKWVVLTGVLGNSDPLVSTYDFMDQVVGYDLAGFFDRHQGILQQEIERILKIILDPEAG